jgi:hypothetical protein
MKVPNGNWTMLTSGLYQDNHKVRNTGQEVGRIVARHLLPFFFYFRQTPGRPYTLVHQCCAIVPCVKLACLDSKLSYLCLYLKSLGLRNRCQPPISYVTGDPNQNGNYGFTSRWAHNNRGLLQQEFCSITFQFN